GNLAGATRTQVAAYVKTALSNPGGLDKNTYAQALGLALNVFATTTGLGWNTGSGGSQSFGFKQDANGNGTGTRTYDVGNNGAAFGVANNTVITVNAALSYFNSQCSITTTGSYTVPPTLVFYAGNSTLLGMANDIFNGINQ